jgi:hypothetical protein
MKRLTSFCLVTTESAVQHVQARYRTATMTSCTSRLQSRSSICYLEPVMHQGATGPKSSHHKLLQRHYSKSTQHRTASPPIQSRFKYQMPVVEVCTRTEVTRLHRFRRQVAPLARSNWYSWGYYAICDSTSIRQRCCFDCKSYWVFAFPSSHSASPMYDAFSCSVSY